MSHDPYAMTPQEALRLVREAENMDKEGIARLQGERLRFLVSYARKHSPLLAEKYRGLPERPELAAIPPLSRAEGVARFDDWVCDRQVTAHGVKAFLESPGNLLEDYLGRYQALTSSGSTGAPLSMVRDARHNRINAALVQSRLWGGSRLRSIPRLQEPWLRACGIVADGGFHSTYLSFLRTQRAYQEHGMGDRIAFFPIDTPLPRLVRELNALRPEFIGTYPSMLHILAKTQRAGQLAIAPLALFSSAEHLSAEVMALVEETFNCPVMDNYCSTEAGEMGMLCSAGRRHLNSDWIIVEPVDADGNPAREGAGDGALITNLANLVQPVIRYRISDKIALRDAPCPCGSPFPSFEVEGRKEDILDFTGEKGPFPLSPITLYLISIHTAGCLAAQFIQRSPEDMEIRYEVLDGADKEAVGAELLERARRMFAANQAANVRIYASGEPVIRGKSGKLRVCLSDIA